VIGRSRKAFSGDFESSTNASYILRANDALLHQVLKKHATTRCSTRRRSIPLAQVAVVDGPPAMVRNLHKCCRDPAKEAADGVHGFSDILFSFRALEILYAPERVAPRKTRASNIDADSVLAFAPELDQLRSCLLDWMRRCLQYWKHVYSIFAQKGVQK